jgi:hypothetical protein
MWTMSMVQRSLVNSLTYCVKPAQSDLGNILELLNEMRTVHRMEAT